MSAGTPKGWTEWSEAEDAALRKMWAEGLTSNVIAERMGRSRSSVMGRIGRQGLPKRGGRVRKKTEQAAAGPQQQASPRVSPAKTARAPEAARAGGVSSLNLPTLPGSPPLGGVGVLFEEAKSTQCAYPLWGPEKPTGGVVVKRYTCGQPTTRCVDGKPSPYCAGHHARCFVRRAAVAAAAGAAAA